MSLSLPEAQLIGVFLESLSYGLYIMIFIQCMQVLRKRRYRPGDYLVVTAVSLFVFSTAHLIVDIQRCIQAFTTNMEISNYAVTYYGIWDTWENLARSSLYVAITIISDAFIIYRTFIVWGRNYFVVVIPLLLYLGDIGVGILWVYTIRLMVSGSDIFTNIIATRMKVFYAITLGLNITCTCLIAYKIWKIQKTVSPYAKGKHNDMHRIVSIIVESASFYSACLVAMIATYCVNSTSMFIFLNSISPIIGIVFSSVIVRVGSGTSHGDSRHTGSNTTGSRGPWPVRQGRRQPSSDRPFSAVVGSPPDQGIQVTLSQTVHTQVDGFAAGVERESESRDAKSEGLGVV